MKKKFLIGLAPLIVIASFAVMPVASQAETTKCEVSPTEAECPHQYVNNVKSGPGVKVKSIAWGTLKLTNTLLGEVECRNIFAGTGENPSNGLAAKGQVTGFYPYECKDAVCTTLTGFITVIPEKLPWFAEAIEYTSEPTVTRQHAGHPSKTEPEAVFFKVECQGVGTPQFFGENNPKIQNNASNIGSKPGQEEFDVGAGELQSEAAGGGKVSGKVKVIGYAEEESGSACKDSDFAIAGKCPKH